MWVIKKGQHPYPILLPVLFPSTHHPHPAELPTTLPLEVTLWFWVWSLPAFHVLHSSTFQRQISRVWRGRMENILLRGGGEEWRVCSKRETSAWWGTLFEMVQSNTWDWDIVRKWPAVKLGPGPECHKWLLWQETGVLSQKRVLSWLIFPFSVLFHVLGYSSFLQWQTVRGCSVLITVGTEELHRGRVQLLSCLGAFTDSQSCLSINEVFPLQFISLDSSSPDC